jgi:hypothetical protein
MKKIKLEIKIEKKESHRTVKIHILRRRAIKNVVNIEVHWTRWPKPTNSSPTPPPPSTRPLTPPVNPLEI